jgi:hypothetical protein
MPETTGSDRPRRGRPSATPEGRESQLVSLAMDLAEKRLRAGTATAQEVTHFLKLGSSREQLEQERLRHENELMAVKRDAIKAEEGREGLFKLAIDAMRSYQGQDPIDYDNE